MPDLRRVFRLLARRRRQRLDLRRLRQDLAGNERQLVAYRAEQLTTRKRRARDEARRRELDAQLEDAIAHGDHPRAVELSTAATHLAGRATKRLALETARAAQVQDALAHRVRLRREIVQAEVELADVQEELQDVVWGSDGPEVRSANH